MQTNLDSEFLGTHPTMNAIQTTDGGCTVIIASSASIESPAGNAAFDTSQAAIRSVNQYLQRPRMPSRRHVRPPSEVVCATESSRPQIVA
jgi:NADP-dependent 3-hydroxy acid dehydrogenase YdfG